MSDRAPAFKARSVRLLAPLVVAALAWGVTAPEVAEADIYQYTDRDGVVHFTNMRPRSAGWRTVIRGDTPGPRRSNAATDRIPARDRSPERYIRHDAYIREAAALYQLPESFIRAIMRVESDFDPSVVSSAGAMGLMQLMPGTASRMGVRDAFSPRENILGGTRYLRILANMFNGDLVLTVAAYNAGEGAVVRHQGVPPYDETRRYVQNVLRYYYAFRAAEAGLLGAARTTASR